jgi:hypothetical protein
MLEHVEFLRRGYEALQRGDLETFKVLSCEHLDRDFEFPHVWDGRVFKGYEGTLEWLEGDRAVRARSFTSVAEALERARRQG